MSVRGVGLSEDDEAVGRAYDARLARRVWAYTAPYRTAVVLSAALFPLLAAVDVVQPYLLKIAIDDHILRGDWPGLSRLGLLFLVTLAVQYMLRYGQIYLSTWTGQRVVHDLRAALFAHVQRLPAAFFDRNSVGRVMTRILGDVEAIGEVFTAGVVAILGDAITLTSVVVAMLLLHLRLSLITFAVLPVLVVAAALLRRPVRRAYRDARTRLAHLNADLQETISGMPVIQLFGREMARARELGALSERYRRAQFRRMGLESMLYAAAESAGAIVVAALLWWGGIEILDGTLTFGVLVAFTQYTQRFYLPIRDASAKFSVMQAATVAGERVFALLDTPAEKGGTVVPAPQAGDARPPAPARRPPAVELRDVWFAYPGPEHRRPADDGRDGQGATAWALRGVSLRIETGERIAIVGGTGAGKTTLARLLTRTYDVQRGAVLVDGVDVRAWDLVALRRHVGLVLQDVVLFAGTVAENLALDRDLSRTMIEDVARRVHADSFIRRLPGEYEASLLERGANLSHGQRQLLSVARALLYNPPVLVLDEATSSVDPGTEHLLQDAVNELLAGRTSVVIAHRFSTIQRADRVAVLQHGQLVDEGPHAVLLRRDGLYRTLWELQYGPDAPGGLAADTAARA
ncbi:MAG TPA: ABC transporter ATP-binding protein [Methylomirabilota bacterium]|nr:ABC transporter ATP-binding protein [Methylomirabilota bacterium]